MEAIDVRVLRELHISRAWPQEVRRRGRVLLREVGLSLAEVPRLRQVSHLLRSVLARALQLEVRLECAPVRIVRRLEGPHLAVTLAR